MFLRKVRDEEEINGVISGMNLTEDLPLRDLRTKTQTYESLIEYRKNVLKKGDFQLPQHSQSLVVSSHFPDSKNV
jgi:hypothetical protein